MTIYASLLLANIVRMAAAGPRARYEESDADTCPHNLCSRSLPAVLWFRIRRGS